MSDVIKQLGDFGIIPVVKIQDAKDAVPMGKALAAGDLPVAEITFRTEAAEEAIKRLSGEVPDMLVGAGTVLTVDQVRKAVAAGARFIVAPGFNAAVVDYCVENGIPVTPGVNTPSMIEMALERGLKVLKFFPAEASGGLSLLNAMAAPYGGVRFIPTGGVNTANLTAYLASPLVLACGGTWIVKADLIAEGKFDEITRLASEAVGIVLGFNMAHVGINEQTEDTAMSVASELSETYHIALKAGSSSIFAGTGFEVMKSPGLGTRGHLAIGTGNIHRAMAYLRRKGIGIREDTAKEKNGKLIAVYLEKEISGFAVHLLQQ